MEPLNCHEKKIYLWLRSVLFGGAFLGALFLGLRIVFPTQYFDFNFARPEAAKNTLTEARNKEGSFVEKGKIGAGQETFFDAGALGFFSKAKVELFLDDELKNIPQGEIGLRKSFQAFLYSEGQKVGFPDGQLLKDGKDLFFVSEGKLRKFQSLEIATEMGFEAKNFQAVSGEDLKFNPPGENISNPQAYPEGALFKKGADYYILRNGQLKRFLSPGAFFSYFEESQAVSWEKIRNLYPETEEKEGFASGSLLAYGTSAFLVSDGLILPIGDAIIFESKGFNWDDLIKVGGDEISFYEKGRLFELDSPHPERTVFVAREDSEYFLIKNHQKHLLPTPNIAKSWIRKTPVSVSKESLEKESRCSLSLETSFFGKKKLVCEMGAEKFNTVLGTDFEFALLLDKEAKFSSSRVILEKNKNLANLETFFLEILGRIKNHYVRQN
ncbi:MAG: hypothetical protein ACOYS2_02620 [Patescibacteria group bacterium]